MPRITLAQLHVPLLRHAGDFYHGEAPPALRDAKQLFKAVPHFSQRGPVAQR